MKSRRTRRRTIPKGNEKPNTVVICDLSTVAINLTRGASNDRLSKEAVRAKNGSKKEETDAKLTPTLISERTIRLLFCKRKQSKDAETRRDSFYSFNTSEVFELGF
jgi:hypothetical protein